MEPAQRTTPKYIAILSLLLILVFIGSAAYAGKKYFSLRTVVREFDTRLNAQKLQQKRQTEESKQTLGEERTYVSQRLGIRFRYATSRQIGKGAPEYFSVAEKGNVITVSGNTTDFQTVEIFSKLPSETLKEVIVRQFLEKYPSCLIETYPAKQWVNTFPESYVLAGFFPPEKSPAPSSSPLGPYESYDLEKCPDNHLSMAVPKYFLMDTARPDKFVFLYVGNVNIPATDDKEWWETIEFY